MKLKNPRSNALPSLLARGDEIEQQTWPELRQFIPHYEKFWAFYVYPLRSQGSIYFRRGIDTDLEWMASLNYSMYVSLGRGHGKIAKGADGFEFFEEIYSDLYRSCELARKTVKKFDGIYRDCLQKNRRVSTRSLEAVDENLRMYRNLLHDGIVGTIKRNGQRLIPKRSCLHQYGLWSKMRYEYRAADFVPAETQLLNDFQALCSAIEDAWKQMVTCHPVLLATIQFQKRIGQGTDDTPSTGVPAVSGSIIIGRSNHSSS